MYILWMNQHCCLKLASFDGNLNHFVDCSQLSAVQAAPLWSYSFASRITWQLNAKHLTQMIDCPCLRAAISDKLPQQKQTTRFYPLTQNVGCAHIAKTIYRHWHMWMSEEWRRYCFQSRKLVNCHKFIATVLCVCVCVLYVTTNKYPPNVIVYTNSNIKGADIDCHLSQKSVGVATSRTGIQIKKCPLHTRHFQSPNIIGLVCCVVPRATRHKHVR